MHFILPNIIQKSLRTCKLMSKPPIPLPSNKPFPQTVELCPKMNDMIHSAADRPLEWREHDSKDNGNTKQPSGASAQQYKPSGQHALSLTLLTSSVLSWKLICFGKFWKFIFHISADHFFKQEIRAHFAWTNDFEGTIRQEASTRWKNST